MRACVIYAEASISTWPKGLHLTISEVSWVHPISGPNQILAR